MADDIFDRLLAAASDPDRMELQLVHNGRIMAMRSYKEAPTRETKGNWDAARSAYDEALARFSAVYLPAEAAERKNEGERFANRKQALNWLQAQGYKVGQDKFYKDCKAGFPLIQRDKTVSKFQVMQYGQQLDIDTRGQAASLDGGQAFSRDDEARKIKADADIACMKASRMQREEDKYWLHADEAWAMVAGLVGTLRDGIRHQLHEGVRELVHLAGGDQERSQEVFEQADQLVSRAFNEIAGDGINVQFEREVE